MKIQVLIACTVVLFLGGLTSCKTTTTSQIEDRFAKADKNHDGKLSHEEFSDYFVTMMFASRDLNHDGKLTWEEWNVPGAGRSKAQFNAADRDKDGTLSLEEALFYCRKRGVFKKEFRETDTDYNGYLTREEVQAYYASKEGPPR